MNSCPWAAAIEERHGASPIGVVALAAILHGDHRLALRPAGVNEACRGHWRSHDAVCLVFAGIESTGPPKFRSAHRIVTRQAVAAHKEDLRAILRLIRNGR